MKIIILPMLDTYVFPFSSLDHCNLIQNLINADEESYFCANNLLKKALTNSPRILQNMMSILTPITF